MMVESIRELIEFLPKAKAKAVMAVILGTTFIAVLLSLNGQSEKGLKIVIPVFISGIIYGVKRELGLFGLLLRD